MNRLHRRYCRSRRWREKVSSRVMPWMLDGTALRGDVLEVGPGPGVTTDLLHGPGRRVTALEVDAGLAEALRARLGDRVEVRRGDAASMPFANDTFDVAVSMTMLHHLPDAATQDGMLAECRRVLRPGGVLVGCDSRPSPLFRLAHVGDTMTLVDPGSFAARIARSGFTDIAVDPARGAFRFRAVAG